MLTCVKCELRAAGVSRKGPNRMAWGGTRLCALAVLSSASVFSNAQAIVVEFYWVRNTPPAFCISVQNIFSASHCIVDIVYLVFHVSSQRRPSVGTGVNRHRIGNPSCLALPQRYLAIKMPPEMQVASWMYFRAASGPLDNYWVVGWSLFSACHPNFGEAPTLFSTSSASTASYTSNPINFSLRYDNKHCHRPNYQPRCWLSLPNQNLRW